ncbi:hypothetical protein JTE90_020140 [Oedothorax gibbosus]|uniref:Uncharacterized protein n=1 Tax=Oedothorax gibbosus TaxID=931172 RepID=A0AAV6U8M7_9ARAC|nr:hypothetical protein JTE90_020140 [Oedothorax gibbosus]
MAHPIVKTPRFPEVGLYTHNERRKLWPKSIARSVTSYQPAAEEINLLGRTKINRGKGRRRRKRQAASPE